MKCLEESLPRWKQDLLWAVNSPELLAVSESLEQPRLEPQAIDEAALSEWCSNHSQSRVGLYFEELVHYYLEEHGRVEMLLRHHQVFRGKQTLGEIDFIYRDHAGAVIHLETAVKFFLYHPHAQGFESQFIGPNSADNLFLKSNRLLNHQLPLSKDLSLNIERRAVWVKGRVFYNPLFGDTQPVLDCILNPDVATGAWIHYRQLDDFLACYEGCEFVHLRKPHWLAGLTGDTAGEKWDASKAKMVLTGHFENQQAIGGRHGFGRPVLLAIIDERSSDYEIERVFVVPDAWPFDRPEHIVSKS